MGMQEYDHLPRPMAGMLIPLLNATGGGPPGNEATIVAKKRIVDGKRLSPIRVNNWTLYGLLDRGGLLRTCPL